MMFQDFPVFPIRFLNILLDEDAEKQRGKSHDLHPRIPPLHSRHHESKKKYHSYGKLILMPKNISKLQMHKAVPSFCMPSPVCAP